MNIGEMHVWFRQYAQQMGMQNVRAILPEQIDILINTSITDTVNQIIRENVGVTNDRIITDNSKIGQINALKSLYKVQELTFDTVPVYKYSVNHTFLFSTPVVLGAGVVGSATFTFKSKNSNTVYTASDMSMDGDFNNVIDVLESVTPFIPYSDAIECSYTLYADNNGVTAINLKLSVLSDIELSSISISMKPTGSSAAPSITEEYSLLGAIYNSIFSFKPENYYNGLIKVSSNIVANSLFLVDFSVNYKHATVGIKSDSKPTFDTSFTSNWFPIRLIDDAYLADTMNDFILKPRLRSPIMVIYNGDMDIYFGKFTGNNSSGYFLDNNLAPATLRVSYIAKPAVVKYNEDINGLNIDCDLPDYMHVDILKHAVDLFRQAVSGGISTQQNNDQANQQESVRNNYRNEGYNQ